MDKPSAPPPPSPRWMAKPIVLDELARQGGAGQFLGNPCPGCIKEMPGMIETYNQYKAAGFEIIAVAMRYDPPNYVVNFVQTRQLPFPVVLDVDGAHARAFGNVQFTPTSFIIGKDGQHPRTKAGRTRLCQAEGLAGQGVVMIKALRACCVAARAGRMQDRAVAASPVASPCRPRRLPRPRRCRTKAAPVRHDVRQCADGSYVSRNPAQHCAFDLCPGERKIILQ